MSRKTLLSGVSAAAFTLLIGGSAMAADVTVPTTTGAGNTVTGHVAVNSLLTNLDASSSATESSSGAHGVVTGSGNTVSVNTNTLGAVTTGNSLTDTVDFDVATVNIGNVTSGGTGIGILGMSLNTTRAFTATTTGSSDTNAINGGATGTYTVDSNITEAATTLNTTIITVTPTGVPLDFTSESVGHIATQYAANPVISTTGDITSVNAQGNLLSANAEDSQSQLAGNSASLTVGQATATTGNNAVGGTEDISHNSLFASFVENAATNSAGATAGDLPSLTGSITVANVQANQDSGAVDNGLAYAAGNSVTANVTGNGNASGTAATETLTGTLTANSNSIDAAAVGNTTTVANSLQSGNSIALTGVNFAAPGGQTQANTITYPGTGTATTTNGGLALLNSQTQETIGGTAALAANNTGSSITSTVQNATTASDQLNTNTITSESTGDNAGNSISVTGGDTINGIVSLGSAQEVNHTNILAATTGGNVQSLVGYGDAGNQTVTGSNISVNSNGIDATATGANVANTLTLDANSVTTGATTTTLTGTRSTAAAETFNASNTGGTINNVQEVFGADGSVTATNTNPYLNLRVGGATTAITGDGISADHNNQEAVAKGAVESSAASVSGNGVQATTFTGGLGVLNAQGTEAAVTATTTSNGAAYVALVSGVGADTGGTVAGQGTVLSTSSDAIRSIAYGTQSTGNTVSVNAGSTTVAAGTTNSTTITVTPADGLGLPFDHTSTPTVVGGVAVFSDQATTADVSASTLGANYAITLATGGNLISSEATADSNGFTAAALGNAANNNSVSLTGNSVTTAGGGAGPIATVANVQSLGVGVDVASVTDSSSAPGAPGTGTVLPDVAVLIGGSLTGNFAGNTGSSADASLNTVEALTIGNTSTNSLSVVAGSGITANDTGTATTGAADAGGTLTNQASFAVTNAQGSGAGTRTATLTDLGIWLTVGNNVVNSSGTTDTNHIIAAATDNDTTNSLTLDPPSIQATAALQNLQLSQAALNVTEGKAGTGATPGTPGVSVPQFNVSAIDAETAIVSGGTSLAVSGAGGGFTLDTSGLSTAQKQALNTFLGLPANTITGSSYFLANGNYTLSQSGVIANGPYIVLPGGGGTTHFTPLNIGGTPPTAATPGTGIIITVANAITRSTLDNSANDFSASATGNTAHNTVSVTAGNASNAAGTVSIANQGALYTNPTTSSATGDYALQNVQTQTGNVVTTSNATNSIIDTNSHAGAVDNTTLSTLTLDGNTNEAASQGNVGTSTVTIAATNSTGITSALLSSQASGAVLTSATANAVVASDLLVASSTVDESANANLALATANTATNSLTAGGGASLGSGYGGVAGSGGAANAGSANPALGTAGASADYALANVQTTGSLEEGGDIITSAVQSVGNSDVAGLGPALTTGSVTLSTVTLDANTNTAQTTGNRSTNSLTLNPTASLSADAGLVNSQTNADGGTAGATTSIEFLEPSVQGNLVDVSTNVTTASAVANVSTNSLSASAGNIQLTGASAVDPGTQYNAAGNTGGVADYALTNIQGTNSRGMTATDHASFSISETAPTAGATVETTGTTLQVDGNTAQALAGGNATSNTLTVAAGANATNGTSPTHAPTGALLSAQTTVGVISSSSTEDVNATGIVSVSTVDMSTNVNLAQSIGNDATNVVNASAVNYASAGNNGFGNNVANALPTAVSADLALQNFQSQTSGSVGSTAVTTIEQSDTTAVAGTAAVNLSTVTIDGNKTTALSTVNNASNTLTLAGTNTGALGGLTSDQNSTVNSTAAATATIGYAEPSSTSSTIALNSNSSTAQATGNSATNALNATASANYTIPAGSFGSTNNASSLASGQYAVLNDQANTGAVTSTNTTAITLALNGTGAGVVSNSTLSASNNTVLAQSTGNVAANSINLSAAVTGTAPAGLSSLQSNIGNNVSATVTGSSATVTAGAVGGVTGSTIGVNSNVFVARSTGNSVVNTITAH